MRSFQLCPCGPVGCDTLAYLGHALLSLPLVYQRPAPQDCCMGPDECKPLLSRESDVCVCRLEGQSCFPAVCVEPRRKGQGKAQAKGVRQLLGQRECCAAGLDGLSRIAKIPQDMGDKTPAKDSRVRRHKHQRAMLLAVVEDNP